MGRAPRQKYDKFGGGRVEINQKEIQEQVDTIIQSFWRFRLISEESTLVLPCDEPAR